MELQALQPREVERQEIWTGFVKRFGGILTGYIQSCFVRLGMRVQTEECEEALQDAYCRLLTRSESEAVPLVQRMCEAEIRAYLRQVALSVVTDRWRQARAGKRGGGRAVHLQADRWPAFQELLDPRLSAEQRLLAWEQCKVLFHRSRAKSTEKKRRDLDILWMAHVEGLTFPEIVERLGCSISPSSVGSVLARWRKRAAN